MAILGALVAWSYGPTCMALGRRWISDPDYSHGFLVPAFSAYLLWVRRPLMPSIADRGSLWGLLFIAAAGGLRWFAAFGSFPLLDAVSLIPCLLGMSFALGGLPALRWAAPSILFLVFMIPLPGFLATQLSLPLQRIATTGSTFVLQTLGVPAVSRGNVVWLSNGKLEVVEACAGLRMLAVFLAMTVGAAILVRRPMWEKLFVAASALVIGVITNVVRISATGVVHEMAGPKLAEFMFHDLAGWLMMPVALGLLGLELWLLSKLLIVPRVEAPLLAR